MSAGAPPMQVTLVPFDDVDRDAVEALAGALRARGLQIAVAEPQRPPDTAFDQQRGQYRGVALLGVLRRREDQHVLGLIRHDIYVPPHSFVLGTAELQGRVALVALGRLHEAADPALFHDRVLKHALYELGQTVGLGPCPQTDCVMHPAHDVADVDRKSAHFCETCRAKLPIPLSDST